MTVNGQTTNFYYGGDGNRVRKVQGGQTTAYVGPYFERVIGGGATSYYSFGSQRVAMRQGGVLYYLHADHLGSASLTTNSSGGVVARQLYYPYGATRWTSGALPTDRRFTGQQWEGGIGLYDYNARWYHPVLGRFVSADTIVPNPANPQSLNRYSYVLGNPLKYTDPTGHFTQEEIMTYLGFNTWEEVLQYFSNMSGVLEMLISDVTWGDVLVAANGGQAGLHAMFLLFGQAGSDRYRLTLWDLDQGVALGWSALLQYEQWEVLANNGSGPRVYTNMLDQPTAIDDYMGSSTVPVPDGYQFGTWADLNENRVEQTGLILGAGCILGNCPLAATLAAVNMFYGIKDGSYIGATYPYIQAPYQGMFGTMYDAGGVPHSTSSLQVSFSPPLGPSPVVSSCRRERH